MADRTIVNLPEATSITDIQNDLLLVVTDTSTNPTNRKISSTNFKSLPVFADNTAAFAANTSIATNSLAFVESPASVVFWDGSDWKLIANLSGLTDLT